MTARPATVSLNGGPPVNFLSSDTNLEVTGRNGEVVYLNTTSITPGFSGDVGVTANGTLSVDGGLSTIAVDFSNNQPVLHSETGLVTYVDTQNILKAGEETLVYRGTADVFQTLQFLASDLRNVERSDAEWQTFDFSSHWRLGSPHRSNPQRLWASNRRSYKDWTASRLATTLCSWKRKGSSVRWSPLTWRPTSSRFSPSRSCCNSTYATTSTLFDLNILNFI